MNPNYSIHVLDIQEVHHTSSDNESKTYKSNILKKFEIYKPIFKIQVI